MGLLQKNVKDRAKLMKAARVAIKDVLKVKKGETVLIVTNPVQDVQEISEALFDVCSGIKARPSLVVQNIKTQMDEAEDTVIKAIMSGPDIIISISHEKMGKDRFSMSKPIKVGKGKRAKTYNHYFHYLLYEGKCRSFWSPSVTKDMFIRTVPVNYKRMKAEINKLTKLLDRSDRVRITTAKGMDISIGTKGRRGLEDNGDFSKPGRGGNLPAGEVFISPELGRSNGTIVFDGSIASDRGVILIRTPIKCDVKGGFVTRVQGGPEAKKLEACLNRAKTAALSMGRSRKIAMKQARMYARNAFNLGELGIGMNPACKIIGNILEDEKVYRTCHIAIGANYDQDAEALIHLDGIINDPTITISKNGKVIGVVKDGRIRS